MAEVTINRQAIDRLFERDAQIRSGLQRIVQKAVPFIQAEAPEFSGELRERIVVRTRDRAGRFGYEISVLVPYALFIIKGRRPGGKLPPAGDPDSDFVQWCEAYGLPPFAAARAIQRNGIEANNFLERGLRRAGRL